MDAPQVERKARFAPAGLAISALAISTSAPLVLASASHPFVIAAWRLIFMFAFVAGACLVLRRGHELKIPRREAALLLALGAVLGAHFGLWIMSLTLTTVTASVVLVTSHPLMVALLSHALLRERLSLGTGAGTLLAFVGVVLLFGTDFGSSDRLFGDVLALGGAVSLGVYLLVGRAKRRAGMPVLVYTTYVYGGAAVSLLAVALLAGTAPAAAPPYELLLFFLMALIPGMFGHTLYNWALRYLRATLVSVTHLAEPIGATILVFLIFAQQPPPGTLLGGAVTLAGILLVARFEGALRAPPAPQAN
jgi:drug/metabolite transporter (DMT)-like permease